ncbi:cobalamin biosynthesis protein CbiD [Thermosulfurimonas marina]|uniref:Cobalt-precorrin-5B C(1)-methyltransferase n=1 Tax=Thermosulfurimonas marina TaxID=2047767 RepID=A0A6H1WTC0_9BACT|nr:cobalt-precorrin-5B (C(1))-methyltransferase CbiD [Thermosulfurimonas marina]QJA06428.1 cobalamin biosynthesis protein CbiD [Thermosulfurimonas marina]
MKKRRLREGFTTGACAAAAAKAAALALKGETPREVEIPFPDGRRRRLPVAWARKTGPHTAEAAVIKDAGDDPDVTHGAEIRVCLRPGRTKGLLFKAGPGVGRVTKPGLPVPPGEPAINPGPRRMIQEALAEVFPPEGLEVEISVPGGETLAQKTLNPRLGIIGGLSILGTTGLVKPLSAEAWLATIESCLSVARAVGLSQVVLSFGRTSEMAHQKTYGFPEEAYILMGDYLEFTLKKTREAGFQKAVLCGQWAKLLKCALCVEKPPRVPEPYGFTTHVRHGVIRGREALEFLRKLGLAPPFPEKPFNTAREVFLFLETLPRKTQEGIFRAVLSRAKALAQTLAPGLNLSVVLVNYRREVVFEF